MRNRECTDVLWYSWVLTGLDKISINFHSFSAITKMRQDIAVQMKSDQSFFSWSFFFFDKMASPMEKLENS